MKVWPIDPLVPRNLRLEVPEKLRVVTLQNNFPRSSGGATLLPSDTISVLVRSPLGGGYLQLTQNQNIENPRGTAAMKMVLQKPRPKVNPKRVASL